MVSQHLGLPWATEPGKLQQRKWGKGMTRVKDYSPSVSPIDFRLEGFRKAPHNTVNIAILSAFTPTIHPDLASIALIVLDSSNFPKFGLVPDPLSIPHDPMNTCRISPFSGRELQQKIAAFFVVRRPRFPQRRSERRQHPGEDAAHHRGAIRWVVPFAHPAVGMAKGGWKMTPPKKWWIPRGFRCFFFWVFFDNMICSVPRKQATSQDQAC